MTELLSRRQIARQAWPVILANMAVPLLALTDTAIIGHTGSATLLGALALAVLIFNFVFWGCGFLRMSTTGFVAQAAGNHDWPRVVGIVGNGLLLGTALAGALILLQWPIAQSAFGLLQASDTVETAAQRYFDIRIWGAPATLGLYVLNGLLIGLGRTRALLLLQLTLNILNAGLDVLLGVVLAMQIEGVALGTVLAEWLVFITALTLMVRAAKAQLMQPLFKVLKAQATLVNLKPLLANNRDVFIRSLFLLAAFAWFNNASAAMGDVVLAANHLLLQLISFSAFFLDGFAFVAEALVGRAIGRKDSAGLQLAIRRSTELAGLTALALALMVWAGGAWFLPLLSTHQGVLQTAVSYLPFTAVYIALSVAAFQLDGIFIGATQGPAMRNASVLAFAGFLLAWWIFSPLQATGLWLSFILWVVLRAVFLGAYWRRIAITDSI